MAKIPERDVSSSRSAPTALPVITKPRLSSSTMSDSHPVLGEAPIITKSARVGRTRSSAPDRMVISSRRSLPPSATTSLWKWISILGSASSRWRR